MSSNYDGPVGFGPAPGAPWAVETNRDRAKNFLASVGRDPKAYGFENEGDVIVSLGRERDGLDSFGIICAFIGNAIRYLGSFPVLILVVLGTVLLIQKMIEIGETIWGWASTWAKAAFPWLKVLDTQQLDALATRHSDEGASVAGGATQALLLSFLPAPVAVAISGGAAVLGKASAPPPAAAGAVQEKASLTSALQSLYGFLTGGLDGELSENDIRTIADATGASVEQVRNQLRS